MQRHWKLAPLFLLAALVAVPGFAQAQSNAFNGTFIYVPQESDNIDRMIEQGTARANFALRPILRSRLKRTNAPYSHVTIGHTASQVSIAFDQRPAITTPVSGSSTRWRRDDGEMFDVSTAWEGGKLRQTFQAEDGKRENVYTISADGNRLTMNVTITSGRLPGPINYKLVYQRETAK